MLLARATVNSTGKMQDQSKGALARKATVSQAKARASDVASIMIRGCIQLHGGIGLRIRGLASRSVSSAGAAGRRGLTDGLANDHLFSRFSVPLLAILLPHQPDLDQVPYFPLGMFKYSSATRRDIDGLRQPFAMFWNVRRG